MNFWISFSLSVNYQKNLGRDCPQTSPVYIHHSVSMARWYGDDCQKGNCSWKPSAGSWFWDFSHFKRKSASVSPAHYFLILNYLITQPSSQFSVTWYIYIKEDEEKWEKNMDKLHGIYFQILHLTPNPWLFTKTSPLPNLMSLFISLGFFPLIHQSIKETHTLHGSNERSHAD